MRTRRLVALACVLGVFTACGGPDEPDADRVIASPLASASEVPVATASPGATSTTGAGSTTSGGSTKAPVTRTAAPVQTSAPNLAAARVKLKKIADVDDAVAMAVRKGDSAIYVAQRHLGTIVPVRSGRIGRPILNIRGEISTGNEQGLLGLAFSPDGKRLYVYFTSEEGSGGAGDDVLREYDFVDGRATSPRDVFRVADPEGNHNGGNVVFGPDGYLYVGLGDGGGAGDAHGVQGNGQNLDTMLGKIVRIDPRQSGSRAYTSPDDNPFVGEDGRDEIWAYGLRNPWRFSFDRSTGDMWIGDVGQNAWEEIDFDAKGSDGGDNYGWRRMEGNHSYAGGTPPSNHHPPIYEYSHDDGNCSVTGGYVYRGKAVHDLKGAYVFADYCVGQLRAFVRDGNGVRGHRFLGPKLGSLASFGESSNGEIYVLSLSGGVHRIDPA
jgi:glucose/arabinose dehydrogenase